MKKKTKSIYIIKNKINDKVYIGQTKNPTQRWAQYKSAVKKGYDSQVIFKAMRKYGFENFWMELLEEDIENYDDREQYWISKYNCRIPNGYNIAPGGQGTGYGTDAPSASIKDEKILQELIDEIIVSDSPLTELAKKYNISYGVICEINQGHTYFNKKYNYPLRDSKKYSKEKLKQITYAIKYELDKSLVDIAEEYGVDKSFLNDINQGHCYHRDYLTYPLRIGKMKKAEIIHPQIKNDLLNSNLTHAEIARKFNCSRQTVSNINRGRTAFDKNLSYPLREGKAPSKGCIPIGLLKEIKKDIIENKLSFVEISNKYEVCKTTLYQINKGQIKKYFDKDDNYPLRPLKYYNKKS